jgi:5'-nucleotidase
LSLGDLSRCRILVSNDDGIAAPGLKRLEKIARQLSKDVWVVAPELEQSGAGHSLTLRRPLRIRQLSRRRFAVDGTPTDAVLLGINQILKQRKPDLVLSGINRGGNMGEDVHYSGTIAAAMEATLIGVPAIAISLHFTLGQPEHWDTPDALLPDILRRLATAGWPKNVLININFPDRAPADVGGIRLVRQGRRKLGDQLGERTDMRGEHYYWIGPMREESADQNGTDIGAIYDGMVSITPLCIDLTHEPTSRALAQAFPT